MVVQCLGCSKVRKNQTFKKDTIMRKNEFLEGYKTIMGVELTKEELVIGAALVAGFMAFLVLADYLGRMVTGITF
jgi:hypothetical protein